jgi:hypothetical protein
MGCARRSARAAGASWSNSSGRETRGRIDRTYSEPVSGRQQCGAHRSLAIAKVGRPAELRRGAARGGAVRPGPDGLAVDGPVGVRAGHGRGDCVTRGRQREHGSGKPCDEHQDEQPSEPAEAGHKHEVRLPAVGSRSRVGSLRYCRCQTIKLRSEIGCRGPDTSSQERASNASASLTDIAGDLSKDPFSMIGRASVELH